MKIKFKYIFLWQLIILLLCTSLPIKMFASENNSSLELNLKNNSKVYLNNVLYDYDVSTKTFNKKEDSFTVDEYFNNAFNINEKIIIKNYNSNEKVLKFNVDESLVSFYIDNEIDSGKFNKVENSKNNEFKLSIKTTSFDVASTFTKEDNTLIIKHKKANEVLKDANQLSAIILENDSILYYGKINEADATDTSFEIPNELKDGSYKILIFAEQINDKNYSNYCSAFTSFDFIKETKKEMISQECENGILCSHVYRDLNDEVLPLCSKGKELLGLNGDEDKFLPLSLFSTNDEIKAKDKNILFGLIPTAYKVLDDGSFEKYIPQSQEDIKRQKEATDGIKVLSQGNDVRQNYADYGEGKICVEFDFKDVYKINNLNLWRYYLDNREYQNTVIVASKDKDFIQKDIIYNADVDNIFNFGNHINETYKETQNGLSINFKEKAIEARYLRIYMNGSKFLDGNIHKSNHIVEIELFGKKADYYFNQGIYFVGMTNIVNTSDNYKGPKYDKYIEQVNAHFLDKDNKNEKVYRMIELQNGIFNTVIPPSNKTKYSKVYFEIFYRDRDGNKGVTKSKIIYDYTSETNYKDRINVDYDPINEMQGEGSFELENKLNDCFYWQCDYHDSYWSGRPSFDNRILDDKTLYIDNRNEGLNNKVWNEIYISYLNNNTKQLESKKVSLQTREENVNYYLFERASGLTENSLIALSNGELDKDGSFKDKNITLDNQHIFFMLYNIDSKDDEIVIRNLGKLNNRVFNTYQVTQDDMGRYIAFRDQLHGRSGAILENDDSLLFSIAKDINGLEASAFSEMVILENEDNYPNLDMNKIYFTKSKITNDYKYIKFKLKKTLENGTFEEIDLTNYIKIDDTNDFPCFFADPYQIRILKDVNKYSGEDKYLHGYWTSIVGGNYHADKNNNIPIEDNESYDPNYLYGKATFYDYYDDGEIIGYPINTTEHFKYTTRIFNQTISDYFSEKPLNNNAYPFYMTKTKENNDSLLGNPFVGNKFFNEDGKNGINPNKSFAHYVVANGMLDKTLKNGSISTASIENPLFNEEFLRGNNSIKTAIANVYNNVSFPFKLNSDGYWEFDSLKDEYATRLKQDPDSGYYLDFTNEPIKVHKDDSGEWVGKNGFFPFNSANESRETRNYHFGMKMDIDFSITDSGKIKVKKGDEIVNEDIKFKFRGDDDFVLYIDDVLVLDLAGIHGPVNGVINFATGEITYYATKMQNGEIVDLSEKYTQTNLYEALGQSGPEYLANGKHKIRLFYTERGRGSSNLKIEFNFPRKNTLDITNEVDTSSASNVFSRVLDYVGGFRYLIKNQATSGDVVNINDTSNHLSTAGKIEFNNFVIKGDDGYSVINNVDDIQNINSPSGNAFLKITNTYNKKELSQIKMKELINTGRFYNEIILNDNQRDLSKMAYLSFVAYNMTSVQSNTGIILNIKLKDINGNIIQGGLNEFLYQSHSNSLPANKWSLIRVDLFKMLNKNQNFDISNVESISLALGVHGGTIYIDNLRANGKLTSGVSLGFSVGENEISDYNSLTQNQDGSINYNSAILSPIEGAWYHASNLKDGGDNLISINKDSTFDLANLDKISFVDKFREGSYIELKQIDSTKNDVFRTSWSILENATWENGKYVNGYVNDNYLALFPGKKTVVNNMSDKDISITDIESKNVSDKRVVLDGNADLNYIFANKNSDTSVDINNNANNETFVYRSYLDPDNLEKDSVALTVAYKNKLISGGLLITKKLVDENGNPYKALKDETYNFHIRYQDIIGSNLENNIYSNTIGGPGILQEVSITVLKGESEASVVVYGIPKNTKYIIHEVNRKPKEIIYDDINCRSFNYDVSDPNYVGNDISNLKALKDESLKHKNIKVNSTMTIDDITLNNPTVEGVVNESVREFVFVNEVTLNPQTISITKKLDQAIYTNEKPFAFHVHYNYDKNHNGLIEENEKITQDILVEIKANKVSGNALVEIPSGVDYVVHEINDENLKSITFADGTKNELSENYICNGKTYKPTHYLKVDKADLNKEIIVTNHGPQSLIIRKNSIDVNNVNKTPLKGAEFTIYDINNDIIDGGQVTSSYYYAKEFDITDKNYDHNINRYNIDNNSYIVNKVDGKLEYYVALTDDEIIAYENNRLDKKHQVVALAIFENIKLPIGDYKIIESYVPSGYHKKYKMINLKIGSGKDIVALGADENLMISDLNHSRNDIQISVDNKINTLAFQFYKKNREGEKLRAEFKLYAIKDNLKTQLIEYLDDTNQILNDSSVAMLIKDAPIRDGISDEFNDIPIIFRGLSPDITYRLVEVKEPDGYKKPEGQWNIKYDMNKQKFMIEKVANPPAFTGNGTQNDPYILLNYRYTDIPSTGGVGNMQIYGLAIMFIASGCLLYEVIKRNKLKGQ